MPPKAGNSTKTISRMAVKRQEANQRVVRAAADGDVEGQIFGRVVRMYGGPQISVITKDKREHRATIRGLLRRRGATPIGIGDVVVLSGREFESRGALTPGQAGVGVVVGIAQDEVFDVIGIMDSRSATKAMKEGLFPAWMLTGSDDGRAAVVEEDDGIYFDEEGPQGDEEDSAEAVKTRDASKAEKEMKRALARSAKTASSRHDDYHIDIDKI
jgi:translation initiation factor IF-1